MNEAERQQQVVLHGGRVLVAGELIDADVVLDDGRIAAIDVHGEKVRAQNIRAQNIRAQMIDVSGLLLAPGYIDAQVNGLAGVDLLADPHGIADVAATLPRYGVTSFLPTIITSPPEVVRRAIDALAALRASLPPQSAEPLGLHLEGPMLNPAKKGAHPARHLRSPSADVIAGWSRAAGVALVTLAPELDGAAAVIAALRERGVVVVAGHTAATAAELRAALDAGVAGVTHLFNAMPPLGHREPGPVGVSLTDDRVIAGLIVDGIHVDASVVALAFALLGPSRTMLVSDSVAAAAMPAGTYDLGGVELITDGESVRLRDGTLAGSVLTLDHGVRNLVAFTGVDPVGAITAATTTPATLLGASHVGRIEIGAQADLVALDEHLGVRLTIVRGTVAHDAR